MIILTRLNGTTFALNSELIETIEETPDTVITTTTGKKFVVTESIDKIVNEVIKYKSRISFIDKIGK